MIHSFYRTSLVFKISAYIQKKRTTLLEDLVAYTNDPVRYKRRIRMLIQLSAYEQDVLKKIRDFETNDPSDLDTAMLGVLQNEVDCIVDPSS